MFIPAYLGPAAHYAFTSWTNQGIGLRTQLGHGISITAFFVTTYEYAESEAARSFTLTFGLNVPSCSVLRRRQTGNFKAAVTERPALLPGMHN